MSSGCARILKEMAKKTKEKNKINRIYIWLIYDILILNLNWAHLGNTN